MSDLVHMLNQYDNTLSPNGCVYSYTIVQLYKGSKLDTTKNNINSMNYLATTF